jgi:hypothetical protein
LIEVYRRFRGACCLHHGPDDEDSNNPEDSHLVIELNGKLLRFRRDGVNVSYTVICLSHFGVCLAIT